MMRPTTSHKEMKKRVKKELKGLAERRFIKGYTQMEIDELVDLLQRNVDGFTYENNNWNPVTISWLVNGKRTGVTLSIDTTDGEVNEDEF